MSIFSWYECEIIAQLHHFGCRVFLVAMIYGQGKIAEGQGKSQGKVREFLFPDPVGTLRFWSGLVWASSFSRSLLCIMSSESVSEVEVV